MAPVRRSMARRDAERLQRRTTTEAHSLMLSCKYLGGHPSHPAPFTRAELAISGLGFVVARIDFENAQSTMAPAREVKTQVLAIPDDEVIALEADQTRAGFSIPLGGIFGPSGFSGDDAF